MFQARVTARDTKADTWHTLSLRWDLGRRQCEYRLDDKLITSLPLGSRTLNGVSYLRIRSAAPAPDLHGIIIRRVQAQITDPNAPAVTREDQIAWQREYVESLVPRWQKK